MLFFGKKFSFRKEMSTQQENSFLPSLSDSKTTEELPGEKKWDRRSKLKLSSVASRSV